MSLEFQHHLNHLKRLKALADTGLVYSKEPYDLERYEEIKQISLQLMAELTEMPLETVTSFYGPQEDYPTPKVDIRGIVLNDLHEVLLVKEQVDGKWSIPGGWADIGYTASEVIQKEIREETGLDVTVDRLLAVYDKKCHDHPPQPHYVYKIVFRCLVTGGEIRNSFDILDVDYFPVEKLPPLSKDRILEEQIRDLVTLIQSGRKEVLFD